MGEERKLPVKDIVSIVAAAETKQHFDELEESDLILRKNDYSLRPISFAYELGEGLDKKYIDDAIEKLYPSREKKMGTIKKFDGTFSLSDEDMNCVVSDYESTLVPLLQSYFPARTVESSVKNRRRELFGPIEKKIFNIYFREENANFLKRWIGTGKDAIFKLVLEDHLRADKHIYKDFFLEIAGDAIEELEASYPEISHSSTFTHYSIY